VLSFKQFLLEAKRERVVTKPTTLYHGSGDYWRPEDQIRTNSGEFHMTTNPRTAAGYSVGEFPVSPDDEPPNDPTVIRTVADANRFLVSTNVNMPGSEHLTHLKIGDQASRAAADAKRTIESGLYRSSLATPDRRQLSSYGPGKNIGDAFNRQIWRLLSAGKGTRGQRQFEGIRRPRPKSDEIEWVIPKQGRMDITRTGTTETPVENPNNPLDFTSQNIPQTRIARPITRGNIGVSGFQGIQTSGPRLTKIYQDVPDRGNYFDLAPLDGDRDHIHASLDPDDPHHRGTR
jgi:hypothetical protein